MTTKTLHCTNAWHETSGGVATFYRALIRAANASGHELRLIVPGAEDRVEETGPTTRIYHVAAPPARLNANYRTLYPDQFLWPQSRIQAILAAERPDVVEVCDKYTLNYLGAVLRLGLLKQIQFKPVVVGLSCERMDENVAAYLSQGRLARWFNAFYMRWLYFPFFDHHLVNSRYTAEELRAASHGHAVRRGVWVMPMGVDFARLSPELRSPAERTALVSSIGAAPESTLLLYAGRLVPEKNTGLLLETLEALVASSDGRDYRLLLAGSGIEQPTLEREAERRLPGRVTFLGHIADREHMARLYANVDLFVHPNPREPFGIAPLEAMASGLPVVAPNSGGVLTYATEENAWIVPADAGSFSAAVQDALRDPEVRQRKARRARSTAAEYDWQHVAANFLRVYCAMHVEAAGRIVSRDSTCSATHDGLEAPYFWSTYPAAASGTLAAAIAGTAKFLFRLTSKHRRTSEAGYVLLQTDAAGIPSRPSSGAPSTAPPKT